MDYCFWHHYFCVSVRYIQRRHFCNKVNIQLLGRKRLHSIFAHECVPIRRRTLFRGVVGEGDLSREERLETHTQTTKHRKAYGRRESLIESSLSLEEARLLIYSSGIQATQIQIFYRRVHLATLEEHGIGRTRIILEFPKKWSGG